MTLSFPQTFRGLLKEANACYAKAHKILKIKWAINEDGCIYFFRDMEICEKELRSLKCMSTKLDVKIRELSKTGKQRAVYLEIKEKIDILFAWQEHIQHVYRLKNMNLQML